MRGAKASVSKEEYAEYAVSVALKLADRLCRLTQAQSNTVRLQDVMPENIRVVLASSPMAMTFTASDVTIESSKYNAPRTPPDLSSSEACFAFGKILFELFSWGDPPHPDHLVSSTSDENQDPLFSDLLLESLDLDVGDAAPPAPKRPSPSAAPSGPPPTYLSTSCQLLVSDLLEAEEGNEFASDTALLSMDDARSELARMRAHPRRFLHDQACPERALEDTSLFDPNGGELYGRKDEMLSLMDAAGRVAMHVSAPRCGIGDGFGGTSGFLCEAVFLSGQGGSGKSSVLKRLVSFCDAVDWSILHCKFDRRVAPLSTFLQSIDNFFAKFWQEEPGSRAQVAPQLQDTFDRISGPIMRSIDADSFGQLCILLPHFGKLFPMSMDYIKRNSIHDGPAVKQDGTISIFDGSTRSDSPTQSTPGSGKNRLHYLFHLVFKSLCSGGRPVALILDDLQWCDGATVDIIDDYIQSAAGYGESPRGRGGLLYVGSFREDELEEGGFLTSHIDKIEQSPGKVNFTRIVIGALSERDINEMLSFKLCLPMRHTRLLSEIIFRKTQGMAIFVVEFLRSIVDQCLTFSVKDRRWVWDETTIDMKVMPEGVGSGSID